MSRFSYHILQTARKRIPERMRSLYHFFLSFAAACRYGFPSRRLLVVGVTGTKGKTTVTELLHAILRENGTAVASSSSLRFRINDEEVPNERKMTMPGRFFIQRFLREAKKKGAKYVILEVTSQGIAQHRHRFIRFHSAIFTNIQEEHIESHGNFENYIRAKLDLFHRLPKGGIAVINRDDRHGRRFSAATRARNVWYGKDGIAYNGDMWSVRDAEATPQGISFDIYRARGKNEKAIGGNGTHKGTVVSSLKGDFNIYNILASAAWGLGAHVPLEKIIAGIRTLEGVSGRMQVIADAPFRAVVDYAHTPDSLAEVYSFLKKPGRRLICVLGSAGGGRDKWKRPAFGKIAAEFCDEAILTNEDPYDEDPEQIIGDIAAGFPEKYKGKWTRVLDRREAIRKALGKANEGDTVVITGKGAEVWLMGPNGSKIPWSDCGAVREELALLNIEGEEEAPGRN